MPIILSEYAIKILDKEDSLKFCCGDNDLEEFFNKDSFHYQKNLIAKVYYWVKDGVPIVMFSVSNDSLKFPEVDKRKLIFKKGQFNSFPAVKIGRFGVNKDYQNNGIGTQAMDYIKAMFVIKNKTGCRFITVDAYNNNNTINFYQKNGFQFYCDREKKDRKTRIMYFDLLQYVNSVKEFNLTY